MHQLLLRTYITTDCDITSVDNTTRDIIMSDWHSVYVVLSFLTNLDDGQMIPPKKTRTVKVPFASSKHALIAKQVIDVDRELQPQAVKRELSVDGNYLIAYVMID